jgi:hypothetical protein
VNTLKQKKVPQAKKFGTPKIDTAKKENKLKRIIYAYAW